MMPFYKEKVFPKHSAHLRGLLSPDSACQQLPVSAASSSLTSESRCPLPKTAGNTAPTEVPTACCSGALSAPAGVGTRSRHLVWCPTGICRRTQRRKREGQKGPTGGRNSSGVPAGGFRVLCRGGGSDAAGSLGPAGGQPPLF